METPLWLVRPVLLKSMQQHFLDIVHGTGKILSYVLWVVKIALGLILSLFVLFAGVITVLGIGAVMLLAEAQNGLFKKQDER